MTIDELKNHRQAIVNARHTLNNAADVLLKEYDALIEYAAIKPLLEELVQAKKDLYEKADFKHGDDLGKYLESEALLISFGSEAANITTEIAKIMEKK